MKSIDEVDFFIRRAQPITKEPLECKVKAWCTNKNVLTVVYISNKGDLYYMDKMI